MTMMLNLLCSFIICLLTQQVVWAEQMAVILKSTDTKQVLGKIVLQNTPYGLLIIPTLKGLTPGIHGLHVHEIPNCGKQGQAAGGHLDPEHTNQHLGPYQEGGHLGDLPALTVDQNGLATLPVLAPRILSIDLLRKRALIIHAGSDNYSDHPDPLGGGHERIGCGIID